MAVICKSCSSRDVEHDASMGNIVCNSCGAVLEENVIVSEVQFSESSAGTAVMQGTFCPEKGRAPTSSMFGTKRFFQSDSREWTINNAKLKIQHLAYAVNLNDHHVDSAHRWYILALQHNFTRGRKLQNVAAACLYIVCRQEKTSHMLLDFSDVLKTNVYELGNIYLKLCRLLNLDVPLVDPSLYIGRFASKLELEDKTQMVANTALRLVSRMKRDWILTGRRPSGICGACLLISSRLYGFSRTQKEIVKIVRVCDITLRKRLNEFAETPSSQLTPEEFHGIWLEQEVDPPSFTRKVRREAQERLKMLSLECEKKPDPLDVIVESIQEKMGEVNLEQLDQDQEVCSALLNEREVAIKTSLWTETNREYLELQEEKLRIQREKDEHMLPLPKKKKKRETPQISLEAASCSSEAAKQLIQSKKLSKKFNYDVLDNLLDSQPVLELVDYIQQTAAVTN